MMVGSGSSSSSSGGEEWILGLPHPNPLGDDLWIKLEPEHEPSLCSITPSLTSPTTGPLLPVTLPTPPHSPPTEHDLDDLVASIPEILESPSASPPSDISDILSDLEGMETGGGNGWVLEPWWAPQPTPTLEDSIKRDIMWGGGNCCNAVLTPVKKERSLSECSADLALRDAFRHDDFSDEEEDTLPDTPSGTDSDCDTEEATTKTNMIHHHSHNHSHHYHSHHAGPLSSTVYVPPQVNNEHNYCGRVPDPNSATAITTTTTATSATPPHGIVTPSDTEDEVDVVSCPEQNEGRTTGGGNLPSAFPPTNNPVMPTKTIQTTNTSNTKRSADVKRQLQLAIQEAMRNRQNKGTWTEGEDASMGIPAGRLVSVKIKTQGKPAAYTKRMRDQHSEVIRSSKHRRRGRGGESDEGRRNVHNSLERQRRVDLRNAFEYLRLLVPETKVLEKAPKVQILKKAADHCMALRLDEERMLREKEALVRRIEELKRRKAMSS